MFFETNLALFCQANTNHMEYCTNRKLVSFQYVLNSHSTDIKGPTPAWHKTLSPGSCRLWYVGHVREGMHVYACRPEDARPEGKAPTTEWLFAFYLSLSLRTTKLTLCDHRAPQMNMTLVPRPAQFKHWHFNCYNNRNILDINTFVWTRVI